MYKVKITTMEGLSHSHWIYLYHKIGDIVEIADCWIKGLKKNVEIVEHYKMITTSKEKCKCCGQYITKRQKLALDY